MSAPAIARRGAPGWSRAATGAAALVGAVVVVDATGTDDGPGLCVFRRCTGGYCPGCGVTRSARHLVHGEWAAAWSDHPWVLLVVAQAAVAAIVLGASRSARVRVAGVGVDRVVLTVGLANVALAWSIWIARLAAGSIPGFL
ncbi:DUF2752 domain-containing protein [Ilumatobacter sp.]|uniref:DUF2752 domain-containing protein n=1 Tax=Ilumatobacter sp. TaxID=1967498 RepID=UPI003B5263D3